MNRKLVDLHELKSVPISFRVPLSVYAMFQERLVSQPRLNCSTVGQYVRDVVFDNAGVKPKPKPVQKVKGWAKDLAGNMRLDVVERVLSSDAIFRKLMVRQKNVTRQGKSGVTKRYNQLTIDITFEFATRGFDAHEMKRAQILEQAAKILKID